MRRMQSFPLTSPIITAPDAILRQKSALIADPTDDYIQELINYMAKTMYEAPGVGLAAVQIAVPLRLAITDIDWRKEDAPKELSVWINPKIISRNGTATQEEGCLSVPEFYADVERSSTIGVSWFDTTGKKYEDYFSGFQAVALQHEFDHLDGKLFIDYISPLRRRMLLKKLKKQKQQNQLDKLDKQ
ncbi:MAG: peptide deformylase [Mariprofundales bacterium]